MNSERLSPERRAHYCAVLDVAENAEEADIKKAFRDIALENHPDRNPDNAAAEAKFKAAAEAYTALTGKPEPSMAEILSPENIFEDSAKGRALQMIQKELLRRALEKELIKRKSD
jgi:hypothetical protein